MTIQITMGWLDGNFVRRARKAGRCEYWRGSANGGRCDKRIEVGQLYAEGELSDVSPNPFARNRYCLACAGPEAVAAVALVGC